MKKKRIIIICVTAFVVLLAGVILLMSSITPINLAVGRPVDSSTDRYAEHMGVGYGSPIRMSEKVRAGLTALNDANSEVVTDLEDNYTAPMHIEVEYAKKHNVLTVVFSGTATDLQGETVLYYREYTVDFGFFASIKDSSNEPLPAEIGR